mmetsp:Transcript_57559/g.128449  ORF Transcript_57559/g.128449 Transcript_57559/m.128449 type:complete len:92 (+) Transcript_57559:98-373(+)
MRSGEDGKTQMQTTTGNVSCHRLRQNLLCRMQQHREKVIRSRVEWMVGVVERAIAADYVDHKSPICNRNMCTREVRGCPVGVCMMDSRGVL